MNGRYQVVYLHSGREYARKKIKHVSGAKIIVGHSQMTYSCEAILLYLKYFFWLLALLTQPFLITLEIVHELPVSAHGSWWSNVCFARYDHWTRSAYSHLLDQS